MHMTGLGRLDSAFDDDHRIVGRVGGSSLHRKFASDLIRHGLLYALANDRIHSPKPLAPLENWTYWTDPKPLWLESLVRAYPPKWMRKAYMDTMLKRDHASGIEAGNPGRGSGPQGRVYAWALAALWKRKSSRSWLWLGFDAWISAGRRAQR